MVIPKVRYQLPGIVSPFGRCSCLWTRINIQTTSRAGLAATPSRTPNSRCRARSVNSVIRPFDRREAPRRSRGADSARGCPGMPPDRCRGFAARATSSLPPNPCTTRHRTGFVRRAILSMRLTDISPKDCMDPFHRRGIVVAKSRHRCRAITKRCVRLRGSYRCHAMT
jgi:hypothetical protein